MAGLEQDDSDREFIESWPGAPRDEESKLRKFHEFLAEREQLVLDLNNKGDQYEDPVSDNLYASAREPEPEILKTEEGMQTEQEKNINSDIAMGCDRMREQVRDSVTEALRLRREEMA